MAAPKNVMFGFLFVQFVLAAIIVGVLCSSGTETGFGHISLSAFDDIIALLISASTTLILSIALFITMFAPMNGLETMGKSHFYLAIHGVLGLLLIGSSISVLILDASRKKAIPLWEKQWRKNTAAGALGLICGMVAIIHAGLFKKGMQDQYTEA